jgi:hypothetical protein
MKNWYRGDEQLSIAVQPASAGTGQRRDAAADSGGQAQAVQPAVEIVPIPGLALSALRQMVERLFPSDGSIGGFTLLVSKNQVQGF